MTPERWPRVRALFEAAEALESAEQSAFLDAHCAGDAQLRAEVQALLDADPHATLGPVHAQAPDLLQALDASTVAEQAQEHVGARCGPWRLLRELGRGGMGAVYLGERDDGEYQQQVAVKLILPGWDGTELLQRFRDERQILAGLNHPNIARLLDGGVSAGGKPYLVLEYVPGQAIDRYCDAAGLGIAARLRLFTVVCEAVMHAHRALIVHRDLKPSNILVTVSGEVKLLDFGIAKLLPAAGLRMTQSRSRVFTTEFAAPEQVRGEATTTGVDIYALGLLLFSLLTGRAPYGQTARSPAAYEHAILTEEPGRPSRVVDEAAARQRGLDARTLAATLRGDLDAIVLKALRKDPQQRYGSVEALAADVRRHLARQPVHARQGNWRYAALRMVQRHAVASALAVVALLSLTTGLAVALWQAEQAQAARARAEQQAARADAVARFMTRVFTLADPAQASDSDRSARALLDQGYRELGDAAELEPQTRSALLRALGQAYGGLGELAAAQQALEAAVASATALGDTRAQVESRVALARVLGDARHYEQALATLQTAGRQLATLEAGLDQTELAPLRTLLDGGMAQQLHNMRRVGEALPFIARAFATQRAAFGETSAQVSELLPLYAMVLSGNQRSTEALQIVERSAAAARAQAGLPAARRKGFIEALAFAYLDNNRYAEAEGAFREVLAIDQQFHGVGQLQTTYALNNVAVTLVRQKRFAEASDLLEQVVTIRQRLLGADDVRIARALIGAGHARRYAGELPAAQRLLEQGLAVWERSRTTHDNFYMTACFALAMAYEDGGDLPRARAADQRLRPFTDGSLKNYAEERLGPMLLLHARLLSRTDDTAADCAAARAVLAVPDLTAAVRSEALVLKAHCELGHAQHDAAAQTLAQLPDTAALPDSMSAYATGLLQALRARPR